MDMWCMHVYILHTRICMSSLCPSLPLFDLLIPVVVYVALGVLVNLYTPRYGTHEQNVFLASSSLYLSYIHLLRIYNTPYSIIPNHSIRWCPFFDERTSSIQCYLCCINIYVYMWICILSYGTNVEEGEMNHWYNTLSFRIYVDELAYFRPCGWICIVCVCVRCAVCGVWCAVCRACKHRFRMNY